MKNSLLIFSILFLLLSSINIGCSVQRDEVYNIDEKAARALVDKALGFIKKGQFDSLKGQLNPQILSQYEPDEFSSLIQEIKVLIDSSIYPNDSEIISIKSKFQTEFGKKDGIRFGFPFERIDSKNSISVFQISVIHDKIYSLNVLTFPKEWPESDPPPAEPHKTRFNFESQKLSWFRIWYEGGIWDNKKYGEDEGFYAVSGGLKELQKTGIKAKFQNIFDLINEAEFDSLDVQRISDPQIGDPEWLYLRMRFEGEYEELDEVEISYFLREEEGSKQKSSGYISLKHSYYTRYLLLAEKNPELARLLAEIGRADYTGFFEED